MASTHVIPFYQRIPSIQTEKAPRTKNHDFLKPRANHKPKPKKVSGSCLGVELLKFADSCTKRKDPKEGRRATEGKKERKIPRERRGCTVSQSSKRCNQGSYTTTS